LQLPDPPVPTSNAYRFSPRPAPDSESRAASVVPAVREHGLARISGRDDLGSAAQHSRGLMLLEEGDAAGAVSIFRAVLRTEPDDVGALVNLGIALETAGQTAEARVWLNRAQALAPGNAAVLYNLATVYDREGNGARATEYYHAFLRIASATDPARSADVRRRLIELDGPMR
jgi:Flp pilus assembly protein TadD